MKMKAALALALALAMANQGEIMQSGIYQMTDQEYHANPQGIAFLSASIISILLTESPMHAWFAHSALNTDYKPEDDKESFDIGRSAHSLILEGKDNICELDFDNWRTNASKEQAEIARSQGMIPLLKKHSQPVRQMAKHFHIALSRCAEFSGMKMSDGKPEQTLIWQDKETGVWCKARLDWLHNQYKLIMDLKSTEASAEPKAATRRIFEQMNAHIQAAWYRRGLAALTGFDAGFIFSCQESKPPFAVSFLNTTNGYLALGDSKIDYALKLWKKCLDTGQWPGYEAHIYQPDPRPWIVNDWVERINEEMTNDNEQKAD